MGHGRIVGIIWFWAGKTVGRVPGICAAIKLADMLKVGFSLSYI